jgi:hypothetical protein
LSEVISDDNKTEKKELVTNQITEEQLVVTTDGGKGGKTISLPEEKGNFNALFMMRCFYPLYFSRGYYQIIISCIPCKLRLRPRVLIAGSVLTRLHRGIISLIVTFPRRKKKCAKMYDVA